ncbi:hypothetical protein SETIT_3G354900v2 [Setaria italica]|uniref:Uncharacterized protein n=1 Tax=Setaria italica TaxID=4555 RepID=A0A368QMN6_SETIT|nr:LRR receptor-like serine/threonine-protein kinase EFR isoform X2 [Setaria italica]RCV19074.1 hypothetical protein SETIT_3G354900v2 [Setaria italica]
MHHDGYAAAAAAPPPALAASPEPEQEPKWTRRDDKFLELLLFTRNTVSLRVASGIIVLTPPVWDMEIAAMAVAAEEVVPEAVVPAAPPVAARKNSAERAVGAGGDKRNKKAAEKWTEDEHRLFLAGLPFYRGNWNAMSREYLTSRTASQIASHYQKYRNREKQREHDNCKRASIHDITEPGIAAAFAVSGGKAAAWKGKTPELLAGVSSLEKRNQLQKPIAGTMELKLAPHVLFIIAALSSESHKATCSTETDRLSLLDFKNSISSDPHATLASWNDSIHFCKWEGISCDSAKHPRRATTLYLAGQGLIGHISPSLGNLTFLAMLNLSQNGFSGALHPSLGHLNQLKFLVLGNNSLQGRIPNELTNCTSLRAVDLSSNQLVGEIPVEIASLSELASLDLSQNNLTGGIPSSLGNISTLSELITTENQLEGRIPEKLKWLHRLTLLALGRNKLSGPIPQSIFNLSSLEIISLESNYLSMPYLPTDLGTTLHNLQRLYLDYNQIGGVIPPSLSNASRLVDINFSSNYFVGHVPIILGVLGKLSWLNLEFNQID